MKKEWVGGSVGVASICHLCARLCYGKSEPNMTEMVYIVQQGLNCANHSKFILLLAGNSQE